mgnify:CR=1 FL=1
MEYIVTPYLSVPKTLKDLQTYCDYYNEVGKRCQAAGLKYGYHNHAHEFQKVEDKELMLDYMLQHTNPEYVFFQDGRLLGSARPEQPGGLLQQVSRTLHHAPYQGSPRDWAEWYGRL